MQLTRLNNAVVRTLRQREGSLHVLERRLNAQTPQSRLMQRVQRVAELGSRLEASARYYAAPRREAAKRLSEHLERLAAAALRPHRDGLSHLDIRLGGLDPHILLARGYAIVTLDGRAVRDAAAVPEGALIEAQLQCGKLHARVEQKEPATD